MSEPPVNTAPIAIQGYTIHRLLGKGGMAEVYLATQQSLRRNVAIKILLDSTDEHFNQRFINEGHVVASLNHPAIITIYDINQLDDGRYYLAMEYISGGDLSQYKGQQLDPLRALTILKQLAEGLAVVHDRGLVHRDIKPANILFRSPDHIVITDFGIAKDVNIDSELTQHGMVVGSPAYSSPEQAQCLPIDSRSDIYSLGIILLELLTGKNLYCGDSYTQTVLNHVQMPIPALPAELSIYQPLLSNMLAKNPHQRFSNCHELLASLTPFLQHTAVSPRGDSLDQTRINTVIAIPSSARLSKLPSNKYMIIAGITLALIALAGAAYPWIAQKITIHRYLASAKQRLAADQLTLPLNNNADYFYRQVLALDPNHAEAKQGLQRVLAARVAKLLRQGETHLAQNRLLNPENDNAVTNFRQALALSPNHPLALQGLHRVATVYHGLAQTAYDQKNPHQALDFITKGLSAEPNNNALQHLRDTHKEKTSQTSKVNKTNRSTTSNKKRTRPKNSLERFWHKLIGK